MVQYNLSNPTCTGGGVVSGAHSAENIDNDQKGNEN